MFQNNNFSNNQLTISIDLIKSRYAGSNSNQAFEKINDLIDLVSFYIEKPIKLETKIFQSYNSQVLLDALMISHTYYLNKILPETELSLSQLVKSQENSEERTPYIFIDKAFQNYKAHLENHILYEEKYIFPYIQQLLKKNHTLDSLSPHFQSLADFYINHSDIGEDLRTIIKLLKKLSATPLSNGLIVKLENLYFDLLIHDKIEEEILIPRMMRLENDFN